MKNFNFSDMIVDNFAGGGGASTGIEAALGRPVDVAINHDREAVAMHAANHPHTRHYCQDVWDVDPVEATQGRRVGLAWFSPDCKHFSKAKGGKPRENGIRDLAWVVHRWIDALMPFDRHPLVIMLENVDEFRTWGPLMPDGMPCPDRRGETFLKWVQGLRDRGYDVQYRKLKACSHEGSRLRAATIRERLFLIARRDGKPIVWPEPSHGPPGSGLPLWRTAADIIDFSDLGKSIFERPRPLKPATCRRIAHGMMKFVITAARPFIVPVTNSVWGGDRAWSADEPLRTITTAKGGEMALVTPFLDRQFGTSRGSPADAPLGTIMTQGCGKTALIAPVLSTYYGEKDGSAPRAHPISDPLRTQGTENRFGLVTAFLAQHNTMPRGGVHPGNAADRPLSTITGTGTQTQLVTADLFDATEPSIDADHRAAIMPFLVKYYGAAAHGQRVDTALDTITAKARFGLVSVELEGQPLIITDIRMRTLQPRELYAAQGFPPDYEIFPYCDGRPLSKTSSIAKCGNSVPPNMAEVLVTANLAAAGAREAVAA